MNTFEFNCGQVVEYKGVNPTALRHIFLSMGIQIDFKKVDSLGDLTGKSDDELVKALGMELDDVWQMAEGTERLFSYLVGFGITTDAPEDVIAELNALGFETSTPRVARVSWVRYVLLEDDAEAQRLTQAIMAATTGATQQEKVQEEEKQENGT